MALDELDLNSPPVLEEPQDEKEEVKEEEKPKEKTLTDYLAEYEGAPDPQQVEKWKIEYGEVLCAGMSETELFVFRPISRGEFVNLQAYLAKMKDQVNNYEVEVKIVETCVLWGSPNAMKSLEKKAGTYSTLHEQILQASNFMNPQYVSQFVIKL